MNWQIVVIRTSSLFVLDGLLKVLIPMRTLLEFTMLITLDGLLKVLMPMRTLLEFTVLITLNQTLMLHL